MHCLCRPVGRGLLFALSALLSFGGTGCSSSQKPYPVSGRVVFEDGQPAKELAGGPVIFTSDELKKSFTGTVDEEGGFRLNRRGGGAFPGKYRVTVLNPEPEVEKGKPQVPQMIDARYADPRASGLESMVEEKTNEVELKVRRLRAGPR
jgi:hypothetical protein